VFVHCVLDTRPQRCTSSSSLHSSPVLEWSLGHRSMWSRWLLGYAWQCPCGDFGFDPLGRILQDLRFASVDMWQAWCTVPWSDIARLWNSSVWLVDVASRAAGKGHMPLYKSLAKFREQSTFYACSEYAWRFSHRSRHPNTVLILNAFEIMVPIYLRLSVSPVNNKLKSCWRGEPTGSCVVLHGDYPDCRLPSWWLAEPHGYHHEPGGLEGCCTWERM